MAAEFAKPQTRLRKLKKLGFKAPTQRLSAMSTSKGPNSERRARQARPPLGPRGLSARGVRS